MPTTKRRQSGFTLIEVLVALLILAVMAGMAWKGLDGIVRSRDIADRAVQRSLRLHAVMTQWQADLSAVRDVYTVAALQFDGAALRLTRRAPDGGMQLVVWALRSGRWVRWAGPSVMTVGGLEDQIRQSRAFQGREAGTLPALRGVAQWQLYCYRDNAWSNCQSSAGVGQGQQAGGSQYGPLPTAVRSVLTMAEDGGLSGSITRDVLVAVQPNQN